MAAITPSTAEVLWQSGQGADKAMLLKVPNVDSADTIDVSGWFKKVKVAPFCVGGVLATTANAGISGTTLTLTLASVSDDTVYLFIVGQN